MECNKKAAMSQNKKSFPKLALLVKKYGRMWAASDFSLCVNIGFVFHLALKSTLSDLTLTRFPFGLWPNLTPPLWSLGNTYASACQWVGGCLLYVYLQEAAAHLNSEPLGWDNRRASGRASRTSQNNKQLSRCLRLLLNIFLDSRD